MLGVANVAVKALTGTVPGDPLAIVSPWAFTALVAGVGAFLALGRGLQTGGAIPVITLSSVTANLVSVAGGIAVFGDPMGTDPLAIAARSVAFAAVIAAAIVLPCAGPGHRRSGLDPVPRSPQCVTLVLTRLRSDSLTGPFFSSVAIAPLMSSWSVSTSERARLSLTRARIIFTSCAFGGIV